MPSQPAIYVAWTYSSDNLTCAGGESEATIYFKLFECVYNALEFYDTSIDLKKHPTKTISSKVIVKLNGSKFSSKGVEKVLGNVYKVITNNCP